MNSLKTLLGVMSGLALVTTVFANPKKDDEDDGRRRKPAYNFELDSLARPAAAPAPAKMMRMAAENLGATPGGAQDISYARERITAGEVPHPNTFTPEGLLSEHDLPLDTGRKCSQTLCLTAAAVPVELTALPEARQLGQLGFASNLDAKSWHRDAMNLVAVVDKSGSMSGTPINTVKASLHQLVNQLGPGDQLSIVLYGDRSHVHLPPTAITASDKQKVHAQIDQITIAGSTNMEAGLKVGYQVATESAAHFRGTTRLMLFTDERPNVGATDKESFMGMARQSSRRGIGLTTIGVGTQFGAEVATAISSVRGGNLFFFPNVPDMEAKFKKDLDTMLSELAYDLKLKIWPQKGYKLAGLFGLPGDLVKHTTDGGLEMTVETIFLSKDRGGIYFAFAPEGAGALPPRSDASSVALASISYVGRDGKSYQDSVDFARFPADRQEALPLGLQRGRLLVDEITTLKKATELHLQKNDQEGAYRLVHALRQRFAQSKVTGLDKELATITKLDETLTRLSGHQGEKPAVVSRRDSVNGLPVAY
jgi:Ca-activated chloride channel family protein